MERSRDGYGGRYRDRHTNDSKTRKDYDDRSQRGNYREHSSRDHEYNSNYSSKNPSNDTYNYRSTRTSLNSRPVSSRNGPSTYYRHHRNDDYPVSSHLPHSSSSSSSNRTTSSQLNYYDKHSSPPSRYDRLPNHRNEQPMLSNGSSSNSHYMDIEQNRYLPSSSSYRRNYSPPTTSSYRNERSLDYGSRNSNHEVHMHDYYRSPPPRSLAPPPIHPDPYINTYRTTDYNTRSERYDIPSNRTHASSHDYPMPSSSSHHELYRSSSNVSMSSSSSHIVREQRSPSINYRQISRPKDYDNLSSTSFTDHPDSFFRDYHHSSNRERPNLKRSNSDYESTSSKRATRR